MDKRNLKFREKEMKEIWNSFEYLFREKLVSLDNMARAMVKEMIVCGVPKDMVDDFVPKAFAKLWDEVAQEQYEKYDKRRSA